jgi:prevent-host-death family protein
MWLQGGDMDVGVRELRDSLSRHLATVRAGHTITVTDHGRPVARIVPVGEPTTLERLIAEGRVTPAQRRKKARPEPVNAEGTVSDLVSEQRR